MTRHLTILAILALVAASACTADEASAPEAAEDTIGGPAEGDTNELPPTPDAGLLPEPIQPAARAVHRMTIDQLRRSLPILTGGHLWSEDFGGGPIDMLAILGPTLGDPDYLLVTREELEPSLIVAKFMQDAALRVCPRWLEADREAPPAERTFVRHADWQSQDEADVRATLQALHLRLFARHVAQDDDQAVGRLSALFTEAAAAAATGDEAHDGWLAVCIAMLTDPALLLY